MIHLKDLIKSLRIFYPKMLLSVKQVNTLNKNHLYRLIYIIKNQDHKEIEEKITELADFFGFVKKGPYYKTWGTYWLTKDNITIVVNIK